MRLEDSSPCTNEDDVQPAARVPEGHEYDHYHRDTVRYDRERDHLKVAAKSIQGRRQLETKVRWCHINN